MNTLHPGQGRINVTMETAPSPSAQTKNSALILRCTKVYNFPILFLRPPEPPFQKSDMHASTPCVGLHPNQHFILPGLRSSNTSARHTHQCVPTESVRRGHFLPKR